MILLILASYYCSLPSPLERREAKTGPVGRESRRVDIFRRMVTAATVASGEPGVKRACVKAAWLTNQLGTPIKKVSWQTTYIGTLTYNLLVVVSSVGED